MCFLCTCVERSSLPIGGLSMLLMSACPNVPTHKLILYERTRTPTHTYAQGPISSFPQASGPSNNLRLSSARPNPNWHLMLLLNLRGQTAQYVCVCVCVRVSVCVSVLSHIRHRRYTKKGHRGKLHITQLRGFPVMTAG